MESCISERKKQNKQTKFYKKNHKYKKGSEEEREKKMLPKVSMVNRKNIFVQHLIPNRRCSLVWDLIGGK